MASRKLALVFGAVVAVVAFAVVACGGGGNDSAKPAATKGPNVADRAATAVGGLSVPGPINTAVAAIETRISGVEVPGPLATAVAGGIPGSLATAAAGVNLPSLPDLGGLLDDRDTLRVRNTSAGRVITDSKGMTLYTSNRDTAGSGQSGVTGAVLQAWPAYILTSGNPSRGDGVSGAAAVITRVDGGRQVTYKGLPLYYWQNDKNPGDVTGNGVGGFSVAMP